MENLILAALGRKNYVPVKPRTLARQAGVPASQFAQFRQVLRDLVKQGRVTFGRNHSVRPVVAQTADTVTGIFRRTSSGRGFVRPHDGGGEIAVAEERALDATTGDEVLVRILRKASGDRPAIGELVSVIERATHRFVGSYHERDGEGLVRVEGGVFTHSVLVGDPGAKGAKPGDTVVFEMLRFPTVDDRGEGVITEVLGPRGAPGVDLLAVIRAYDLPDEFPPEALEEARVAAETFDERELDSREDLTGLTIVTIDPADARDFDDAISLTRDAKSGHWQLGVHIADVGHFAPVGGALDREARRRGNSVYLPQRVLPMFPELISNGLASLQQGRVRYVKSALMEFTAEGQRVSVRFANAAIKVTERFAYEQVSAILQKNPLTPIPSSPKRGRGVKTHSLPSTGFAGEGMGVRAKGDGGEGGTPASVVSLLLRMRDLGMILRARRRKRGSLELSMPEVELDYDDQGRMIGAHFSEHDISHQIIEEFMLSANEAVAEHLAERGVPFLRRVHPAPDPAKLQAFGEFARILGYDLKKSTDRYSLQRVLERSADKPERHAIHYALLRSLKQATYSPYEEEHYALASKHYCHFTSPIRRYPDLTIHRTLDQLLRTGRAGADITELVATGDHCTRTERRADAAERDLIKTRLLTYLSERMGLELNAIITGVADYGFFAQAEQFPAEGLVHVSTLADDYYHFDSASHTIEGRRGKKRYRLGDKVRVQVVRVDLHRKQLDLRVVEEKKKKTEPPIHADKRGLKRKRRK
jgi:ribonuclease R